jgi:predicted exporter/1-acyl-sn-glycerol-3-phosphate acyltransferase/ubiquinone/menaquinone biosynthesis C-methylase UbiE
MNRDPYTRLYLWLVSHRPLVIVATILVSIICVLISSRLNLEEDILGLLPQNDQVVDDYKYTLRKFRQIDRVYVDVGIKESNPDVLGQAADEFYSRIATNSTFTRVMYRLEAGDMLKVMDFVTGALPNLFTEADAAALTNKLNPAKIREYLTKMRRDLAGMQSMVLKQMVAADPILMTELVGNKVLPLQTGFGDAQIVEGRITSGDGNHVLLMAEPSFGSSNSKASEALVADLLSAARDVEKHFPGVHIAITGGHRMSVDNATLIKHDARRCILLGMAAMLVLCLTAYRRRWLASVTFLPSLFGTLMAGVVLAIWHNQLSAIATGFATIAIGITVDYAIYVIYHLDDAAGLDREGVGRHVGRLVLPIAVGALTTMAAFAVMASSPMHGYQQLGIFGAAGVLFSAAFALVILPLLVPIPKQTGQPPLWLTRLMGRFTKWRGQQLAWLLLVVVAATIFTGFGIRRLRFEGDVAKFNGITEATRADDAIIRKTWGDALEMTLVVARGATEEEALQKNDHATEVLAHDPDVKAVYSLASVCPSEATQRTNIARWTAFWTPARRDALRQTINQIGTELGFRTNAFETFWQRIEGQPKLLTLEMFRGTPLDQVLNERVALAPGDNAVTTLVKLDNRTQATARLRHAMPQMIVLDQRAFTQHIADLAKNGVKRAAFWTSLLVMAIVYFSLGSIELVVATLLPLAFGLLWTFGAMGWLGLPIDMMNSMFVIFIIGVGEDYSVFLVTSKLDEWRGRPQRIAATSASVLISALTTIFGFAVLVFARHPVLFSMGTTVLLGMVFAFAATLILTPFFMDLLLFRPQPRGAPRWWQILGTGWVLIHLGSSQFFLYYILRPILKLLGRPHADDEVRAATRWMARGVVKWMPFGKLEFQNISRETFAKPAIVISNHQSSVDVMLIVSLPGDVRQTAKKRVFDNPMLGIGCKVLGHVLVEPDQPEVTLQRCREILSSGSAARAARGGAASRDLAGVADSTAIQDSEDATPSPSRTSVLSPADSTTLPRAGSTSLVHFFPEGTRSRDGFLQRFHRGAFELAIELNQDILPIVLCDSWTAVPRDAYWFERFHTTVRAWPRITPENFDYSKGSLALMRHCESVVRDALQKQLDEINTPKVLRRKVDRLYRYQGKFVEQFVHWKMKMDPMFPTLDSVVPQGFVLDLGCGYGIATNWLNYCRDTRTFLGVDYDETKIRIAQQSALDMPRVRFELQNLLEWEYPQCDAVLLLDVLHYWTPDKQQLILNKARKALRPGGRLILREAARQANSEHRHVELWERIATRIGHNRTKDGLHFRTIDELTGALKEAGLAECEIKRNGGNHSNVLLVAR